MLHLRDEGLLERGDDGWTAAPTAVPGPAAGASALPVTLSAVLIARLDRLDESLRTAVQAAAVLGETFDPTVLAAVLADERAADERAADERAADERAADERAADERAADERTGADVTAAVADGEAVGIWHRREDGLVGFRHALVRDAAYDVQLDERLRARHRRTAAVLAARGGRGSVPQAAALAHHEERAGRPRRAAAHLRRAGALAAEQFAYRDACGHLARALDLAGTVELGAETRSRLHERLGDAAHTVGDYERAVVHLRAAVETAAERPTAVTVGLWTRIGEALERTGRDDEAAAAFEAALAVLQDAPDLATASRIYAGLALVHGRRGELDAAVELAEVAMGFARGRRRPRGSGPPGPVRAGGAARPHSTPPATTDAPASPGGRRSGTVRASPPPTTTWVGARGGRRRRADAVAAFRVAVAGFEAIGHEHGLARARSTTWPASSGAGRRRRRGHGLPGAGGRRSWPASGWTTAAWWRRCGRAVAGERSGGGDAMTRSIELKIPSEHGYEKMAMNVAAELAAEDAVHRPSGSRTCGRRSPRRASTPWSTATSTTLDEGLRRDHRRGRPAGGRRPRRRAVGATADGGGRNPTSRRNSRACPRRGAWGCSSSSHWSTKPTSSNPSWVPGNQFRMVIHLQPEEDR